MGNKRLIKACEILDYAINNHVSAKAASIFFGFGKNYISDVRRSYIIAHTEFQKTFQKKYDEYEKNRRVVGKSILDLNSIDNEIPLKKHNSCMSTYGLKSINIKENLPNKPAHSFKEKKEIDDKILVVEDYGEKTIEWTGNNNIKTLDELLIATKTDKELWNVKNHIINKWDTTFIDSNKKPHTIQNFQVKATLEKNIIHQKNINAAEEFIRMVNNYTAPVLYVPMAEPNNENNLLEISLFDLHIGKLAHIEETGEEYNVEIAIERYLTTIRKLINQSASFSFNRILFPIGNDFFNVDNYSNSTTKLTPQDESTKWFRSFSMGAKLLIDAINLLKQTGVPVDILIVSGNHDRQRSFYLGEYLTAWFNEDNQVNVNNSPSPRKYYKFGRVLLGFTHGDEEKESSLPMIMATDIESRAAWSETVYHEYHIGHQHRKKAYKYNVNRDTIYNEESGVIVRYLSSLTSTDSWHHLKGFNSNLKAAEAFVFSSEHGLMAHLNVNI